MSAYLDPFDGRRAHALCGAADRVIAWRDGVPVTLARFLADVEAIARHLPVAVHAVNLCEDRYAFIAAFCAVAARGQTNLLSPSRAPRAIDQVMAIDAQAYAVGDAALEPAPARYLRIPNHAFTNVGGADRRSLDIDPQQIVAIGFTSGSTGQPKANTKRWRDFEIGTRHNAQLLMRTIGLSEGEVASIVATVPAQHMYGIEMSVLLPLLGPFAVHAGKPFFPADIAAALAQTPSPRVLVTTPIHLRNLLLADTPLPDVAAIVSATAPLAADIAALAEQRFAAPVIELFGSTETCVIAHRRSASEDAWRIYDGVTLRPQPDGTLVEADHIAHPVVLQDVIELLPEQRFALRGRNADLLEIAGKRASLGDLTRRLLAVPGVDDGVVFQLDECEAGVRRIAALVVAPSRNVVDILDALRRQVDPVFLPRPLRRIERLPRNETGKLPRAALLAALTGASDD